MAYIDIALPQARTHDAQCGDFCLILLVRVAVPLNSSPPLLTAEVSASSARAAAKNVRCSNRILIFKCQEAHHLIQGTQTRTVASRVVHRVFVFVVWITIYICRI